MWSVEMRRRRGRSVCKCWHGNCAHTREVVKMSRRSVCKCWHGNCAHTREVVKMSRRSVCKCWHVQVRDLEIASFVFPL